MPICADSSLIYRDLLGDQEVAQALSDQSEIASLIEVERALARAQTGLGLIPIDAGETLDRSLSEVQILPKDLTEGTASAGVPVPSLVAILRERLPADAAHWVHWGATSHDIADTAQALRLGTCLDIFEGRLNKLIDILHRKSIAHEEVIMAGRTRGRIATPITFGLKIAQWAQPLIIAETSLDHLRKRVLRVQFGGASGANTAVAPNGPAISEALAGELSLQNSPPWHTDRGPLLDLAAWVSSVTVALSKIAADIALLSRSELRELAAGRGGGSSTMPQKSNPVTEETIIALNIMVDSAFTGLHASAAHAEERDGAKWMAEWLLLPRLLTAGGAALLNTLQLAASLEPNPDRMRDTLENDGSAMAEAASFALAQYMSRLEAQNVVKAAAAKGQPLKAALSRETNAPVDWDQVFDLSSVIAPSRAVAEQIFAQRDRRVSG